MMRTILLTTALGMAAASQAQTLYAVAADKGLYSIDVGTAAATKMATLDEEVFGLAVWPDDGSSDQGSVFVTNSKSELLRVEDLVTGRLSDVLYTLSSVRTDDLDFGKDPDEGAGLLAATDEDEAGFVFTSLARGPIKTTRPPVGRPKAFAMAGDDFWTLGSQVGAQKVTKSGYTGGATELGALQGTKADIEGMAYDGSKFYGLDGLGNLYSLDLDNQKATLIGDTKVRGWYDASFGSPVPEPSALVAFGALAWIARRRNRSRQA
jgi:hypothetical protein